MVAEIADMYHVSFMASVNGKMQFGSSTVVALRLTREAVAKMSEEIRIRINAESITIIAFTLLDQD